MILIKRFSIILISSVLVLVLANPIGLLYDKIFNIPSGMGSFFFPEFWSLFLEGLISSYIFCVSLFSSIFGEVYKYWWLVGLVIPGVALGLYLDPSRIYFPITLGVFGWVIGIVLKYIVEKFKRPKIS